MRTKSKVTTTILLIIGTVVLINILAGKYFFRLDFTEDKRYTLSEATKDILENLESPITVKAYFSDNLPPQLDVIRREMRDLLIEYSQASRGMVVYEFLDPVKDEELQAKAQQDGVMQSQVQVQEKDQVKVQIAYMGLAIEQDDRKESIPVIQSVSGLEYNLTSSIKKLSVVNKPMVGLLRGHGEAGTSRLRAALRDLQVLYQVEEIVLTDSTDELQKFNTVAILGPTDSIPENHLNQLSAYIQRGGHMLVAVNRVDVESGQGYNMGKSINTGLESWLNRIGVDVNNNFVLDANAASVMVQVQQGPFIMQQPVTFPYMPIIVSFEDHPVVGGLEQVVMQYVSSVNFTGDSAVKFTPLFKSSELTTTQPSSTYIDVQRQWQETDFQVGSLTLAAALEGPVLGTETKMVIIGDADFPISEGQQQSNPDNISLFVNAIDWLSDDTGLIELRTQGATARPLDDMEELKRGILKYVNVILPILLVLGYGIYRAQRNRKLRIKRREVGYV